VKKISLEVEDKLLDSDVEITDLDSLLLAIIGGKGGLNRVVDAVLLRDDGHETFVKRSERESLDDALLGEGLIAYSVGIPGLAANAVLECRHREMPPAVAKLLGEFTGGYVADEYPPKTVEEVLQSSIWKRENP
jgi:hypothetical protein